MSDLVERLRYATRDVVTGERLESGVYGHAPVEDLEMAADRIFVLEGALGHAVREVERLRADAERYITIRDFMLPDDVEAWAWFPHSTSSEKDAAIDAARNEEA